MHCLELLADTFVRCHFRYRLAQHTLQLATYYVDVYLSCVPTPRRHLQLVGIAAMFVSSKVVEVHPPSVQDFVYIADYTYVFGEAVVNTR